jgi:BirA family biotin operon repressor/biotin-[acetyl-CoA-carboxylase] ligase
MMRHPKVPDGCRLIAHKSIGSTNAEARRLAADGAPDRTVVWGGEQTAGRGRHGRDWSSPPGNLYISIVLRPDCAVAQAPQIGFVVGVAMADAIRALSDIPVELKWPNDLLVSGKKVSGLLLESAGDNNGGLAWVIAGIGVNIEFHPQSLETAGNLREFGATFSVEDLIEAFLLRLFAGLDVWAREGFAVIRDQWNQLALPFGTEVSVKLPDRVIGGFFEGIDAAGNMALRHAGQLVHVAAGDVFPLSSHATGVS